MEIKIEKGIKIPKKGRCGINYPFEKMIVGDSFFIPFKKGQKPTSLQCQLNSNAKSFTMHNKEAELWKFKTAKMGDGIRVWRIR